MKRFLHGLHGSFIAGSGPVPVQGAKVADVGSLTIQGNNRKGRRLEDKMPSAIQKIGPRTPTLNP